MQESYEIILFVALIINVIVIIAFFQMSGNVAKIKQILMNQGINYLAEYKKHIAFGNKADALKALQDHVWSQYTSLVAGSKPGTYNKKTQSLLSELRTRNEKRFEALGSEYPNLP